MFRIVEFEFDTLILFIILVLNFLYIMSAIKKNEADIKEWNIKKIINIFKLYLAKKIKKINMRFISKIVAYATIFFKSICIINFKDTSSIDIIHIATSILKLMNDIK